MWTRIVKQQFIKQSNNFIQKVLFSSNIPQKTHTRVPLSVLLATYEPNINLSVVTKFSQVLNIAQENILENFHNISPQIQKISKQNLSIRCQYLKEKNITSDLILKNPWLFAGSSKLLYNKIEIIALFTDQEPSAFLPLLKLSLPKLRNFFDKNSHCVDNYNGQSYNRIHFLCHLLECNFSTSCNLLIKHKFLQTMSSEKMINMVKFLEENSLSKEDIVKDPYILNYSVEVLTPRIQEAKDVGMSKIKPWLVRSQQDIFHRSLLRFQEIKEYLESDPGIEGFLKRRLQFNSLEDLVNVFRSHPRIKNCSAKKLGYAIDELEKLGYNVDDIKSSPRVLTNSVKTVLNRYHLLKNILNGNQPKLTTLAISKKQFFTYVSRIMKSDTKNVESVLKNM